MGAWEGVGCLLRSQSREGFLGEGEEDVSLMPWWFNLLARLITVLVYEASPGVVLGQALAITDIAGLPDAENLVRVVIGIVYTVSLLVAVAVADRPPLPAPRSQVGASAAKVVLLALMVAGAVVAASAYLVA